MGGRDSGPVRVRPLVKDDLVAAAVLHRRVLNSEFLSHCGLVFMRTYYRAWVEAPGSIAIAAVDESGDLLGRCWERPIRPPTSVPWYADAA